MNEQDFVTTILVDKTPAEVFNAINNPRGWWSEEITGNAEKVNEVFCYHFEDIHRCKVRVNELTRDQKVVWYILENDFNFTKDKSEWVGTKVTFEICPQGEKTAVVFRHIGLVPDCECYEACHQGWTHYIGTSLKNYIHTGTGNPNKTGASQTPTEEKLSSPGGTRQA